MVTNTFIADSTEVQVQTSVPSHVWRHNISDEEFMELCKMRNDHVVEIFWGMFGAVVGTLAPFTSVVQKIHAEKVISIGEFAHATMFSGALILGIYCAYRWYRQRNDASDIAIRIRSRSEGSSPA